ncbi:hypothetical protein BH23ACT9_BH23ACT9_12430 [soil metagenome]
MQHVELPRGQAGRLLGGLLLVALLSGCGGTTTVGDDPPAAGSELTARMLTAISILPEEAQDIPSAVDDAASLDELTQSLVALDPDAAADLADVDVQRDLVIAIDIGECSHGTATVVLDGDQLTIEGRESDGVCEAINHEVQVWAVDWAALPDVVTVGGTTASRP